MCMINAKSFLHGLYLKAVISVSRTLCDCLADIVCDILELWTRLLKTDAPKQDIRLRGVCVPYGLCVPIPLQVLATAYAPRSTVTPLVVENLKGLPLCNEVLTEIIIEAGKSAAKADSVSLRTGTHRSGTKTSK